MMNKHKIATLSALYIGSISIAFASEVTVNNNTDNTIHVFFQGKQSKKAPHVETIAPHSSDTFTITEEHIDNKPIFKAIASTSRTGDPDWKLLAGICDRLNKDVNYKLIIETTSMGLKTSCTSLPQ